MIAIVSSNSRERAAFATLCESRKWPCVECDSLRAWRKRLRDTRPRVVLVRHQLGDGYSDDVIAALIAAKLPTASRIVVLAGAGTPQSQEARHVTLGADCVLRDPVRTDVLLEYLARYLQPVSRPKNAAPRHPSSFRFAGATVFPLDRRIEYAGKHAELTAREVQLIEQLADNGGDVVTYATLYSEILGRRFRGETSNMRVLLGKLDASCQALGIVLRKHLQVIPKMGYRYSPPRRQPLQLAASRDPSEPAAA